MYQKKITDAEHLYAQYLAAFNYNGAVLVKDTKAHLIEKGFWFEFTLQPTPMSREYRVLIVYISGYQPYTYVLHPNIVDIADNKPLPHVYSQSNQRLCLTYPSDHEWTKGMLITKTYLPWISMWLYYYEEWLLSNKWKGGGKHPGDNDVISNDTAQAANAPVKRKNKQSIGEKPSQKADKVYNKRKKLYLSNIQQKELHHENCQ